MTKGNERERRETLCMWSRQGFLSKVMFFYLDFLKHINGPRHLLKKNTTSRLCWKDADEEMRLTDGEHSVSLVPLPQSVKVGCGLVTGEQDERTRTVRRAHQRHVRHPRSHSFN